MTTSPDQWHARRVARSPYDSRYRRAREQVLRSLPLCGCRGCPRCTPQGCFRQADTTDHVPPIADFAAPELWVGELVPMCRTCNLSAGGRLGGERRWRPPLPAPTRQW